MMSLPISGPMSGVVHPGGVGLSHGPSEEMWSIPLRGCAPSHCPSVGCGLSWGWPIQWSIPVGKADPPGCRHLPLDTDPPLDRDPLPLESNPWKEHGIRQEVTSSTPGKNMGPDKK